MWCPSLTTLAPSDDNHDNWFPNNPADCADAEVDEKALEDEGYYPHALEEEDPEYLSECKWKALRQPLHPSPFEHEAIDYTPKVDQRLINRFRDSGLQIIVKMASIELTPEKPEFPVGGWHVEGQMNERICATALYYVDSENITSSNLSFRMQTSSSLNEESEWRVGQDCYSWMNTIYGTEFGNSNRACLQNYGSVETRAGRLLCFPNVL
jgi:hypothetical protein